MDYLGNSYNLSITALTSLIMASKFIFWLKHFCLGFCQVALDEKV